MSTPKPPPKGARPDRPSQRRGPAPRSRDAPLPDAAVPDRVDRIAGLPAVRALFDSAPERVLRLFYEDRLVPEVGALCAQLARMHRPYRLVPAEELSRIAQTMLHGGVVAVAEHRPLLPFDPATARLWAQTGQPLFLLDGVGNPHNLGAIARTLAFCGFKHLLLSDHPDQAGLSDAAYRVAQGGLEYLQIRRAASFPATLKSLSQHYRVIGLALGRGVPLEALAADPRPMAVVLGNEEEGLPRATLNACETIVTLPGHGRIQSLNVAATAAILAYALRRVPEKPGRPGPLPRRKRQTSNGRAGPTK